MFGPMSPREPHSAREISPQLGGLVLARPAMKVKSSAVGPTLLTQMHGRVYQGLCKANSDVCIVANKVSPPQSPTALSYASSRTSIVGHSGACARQFVALPRQQTCHTPRTVGGGSVTLPASRPGSVTLPASAAGSVSLPGRVSSRSSIRRVARSLSPRSNQSSSRSMPILQSRASLFVQKQLSSGNLSNSTTLCASSADVQPSMWVQADSMMEPVPDTPRVSSPTQASRARLMPCSPRVKAAYDDQVDTKSGQSEIEVPESALTPRTHWWPVKFEGISSGPLKFSMPEGISSAPAVHDGQVRTSTVVRALSARLPQIAALFAAQSNLGASRSSERNQGCAVLTPTDDAQLPVLYFSD